MLENTKICFVGAGSMAESIIAGIIDKKLVDPGQILVTNRSDQERLKFMHQQYGVTINKSKREAVTSSDIIVLAMKPKDVVEALAEIGDIIQENQLVLSVLAGISISFIQKHLSGTIPIIRTMPNTSSQVGLSATAMATGEYVTPGHIEMAKRLLESVGIVCLVDEHELDIVTGLSGSGPAYVYYMVEAMEAAAQEEGLSPQTARQLIIQTLLGAGQMLRSTGEEASLLREKVTSPGGTTMAGLETLNHYRFQEAIKAAVHSASKRSRELGVAAQTSVKAE